jgi:hypothetical protein
LGQGVVDEYADLARRAIDIGKRSGDRALQVVLGTNGYAFVLTGAYREGLRVVDRAIELAADDPLIGGEMPVVASPLAFCHATRGMLLTEVGDLPAAASSLEAGRELAREQGDLESLAIAHLYSSWHALAAGNAETLLSGATDAVEISERSGDALSRVWAWTFLGMSELARSNWHSAIEALERADGSRPRIALRGGARLPTGPSGRGPFGRRGRRARPWAGDARPDRRGENAGGSGHSGTGLPRMGSSPGRRRGLDRRG